MKLILEAIKSIFRKIEIQHGIFTTDIAGMLQLISDARQTAKDAHQAATGAYQAAMDAYQTAMDAKYRLDRLYLRSVNEFGYGTTVTVADKYSLAVNENVGISTYDPQFTYALQNLEDGGTYYVSFRGYSDDGSSFMNGVLLTKISDTKMTGHVWVMPNSSANPQCYEIYIGTDIDNSSVTRVI